MPRKVVRRRGKGIFGDAGGWLGSQAGNALGGLLGFGRKRRVKRRGGALFPGMEQFKLAVMPRLGMAKRRVKKRVGRGVPDWLKPLATKAKEFLAEKAAHYVGTKINPAAGRWLQRGAYHLGNTYGFGRKRRRGGRAYSRLLL